MNYYRSPRGIRYGAVAPSAWSNSRATEPVADKAPGSVSAAYTLPPLSPRLNPQGTHARGDGQGGKTHQVTVRVPPGTLVQVDQVNYPSMGHNLNEWMLADGHPAVRRTEPGLWEVRTRSRVKTFANEWQGANIALLRYTFTLPDGSVRHLPETVIAAGDAYYTDLANKGRRFFPGDPKPSKITSSVTRNYINALSAPAANTTADDLIDDLDDLDEDDLDEDAIVATQCGDGSYWDAAQQACVPYEEEKSYKGWLIGGGLTVAAVATALVFYKRKSGAAPTGGGAGAANWGGRGGRRDWDDGYRY